MAKLHFRFLKIFTGNDRLKSAPSKTRRVKVWQPTLGGSTHKEYISLVNELQGGNEMSIADMLAYIYTHLPTADEFTIEQIFDFLQEVEY